MATPLPRTFLRAKRSRAAVLRVERGTARVAGLDFYKQIGGSIGFADAVTAGSTSSGLAL